MFTIPTYIGPSRIQGNGVFSLRPVRKGEVVWSFNAMSDVIIPFDQIDQLPLTLKDHILTYSYLDRDISSKGYLYSTDNAKYINHSSDPNIMARGISHTALRDIAEHEELSCDYSVFDWDGAYEVPYYVFSSEQKKRA